VELLHLFLGAGDGGGVEREEVLGEALREGIGYRDQRGPGQGFM